MREEGVETDLTVLLWGKGKGANRGLGLKAVSAREPGNTA